MLLQQFQNFAKNIFFREIFATFVEENKKKELLNDNYIISKYQQIQELTPELINQFILKIEIGKLDEKTYTREIKITWNF